MSTHIRMVIFLSLGLLVLMAWHFGTVLGFFGTAPATRAEFFMRIWIFALLFLGSSIATAGLIAARDKDAVQPDEREKLIELKAEHHGAIVVFFGLIFLMWIAFEPLTPMQTANAILAVICIGELTKIISGLMSLRRGV